MTAENHHEHRDVTGGWLRPAVFGAMDGLVSNFALIAGIAGGSGSPRVVLLAGLAGLAAG
ncbi:VIT1/CCC1 transporter family protein, partial [Actinomadura sp. WAC 06369]|uniref:VIT1/CCC1 transporter family protein n=3 Tax=Actinomadura TaxID=1988 RepID=UPI001000A98E